MKPERQIILLAASILLISCFFLLPRNQSWMAERILPYWKELPKESRHLSEEERKTSRYGNDYTYSKLIAGQIRLHDKRSNILVLLPPTSYFKARGLIYHVPEPAIFYYYTGLKTVWINSPEATKANWMVRADKGRMILEKVNNNHILKDSVNLLKKYPVAL